MDTGLVSGVRRSDLLQRKQTLDGIIVTILDIQAHIE